MCTNMAWVKNTFVKESLTNVKETLEGEFVKVKCVLEFHIRKKYTRITTCKEKRPTKLLH